MDKKQTWNLGYWVIAIVLLLMLQNIWQNFSHALSVPYSEFAGVAGHDEKEQTLNQLLAEMRDLKRTDATC